jgi:hypothetical protein
MIPKPTILLAREVSTLVDTRKQVLGIQDLGNGNWHIAAFIHAIVCPDELESDDDGNTIVPEGYEGVKVIRETKWAYKLRS